MSVAFSNTGEAIIQQDVNVSEALLQPDADDKSWKIRFEVQRCQEWITDHTFKKVALQFPDEYLRISPRITLELQSSTNAEIIVLADTSYGSCCVDEVAAEHYKADAIIHFGRACLSPTRRLPVLHVFGQQPIDVGHCVAEMLKLLEDHTRRLLLITAVELAQESIVSSIAKVCPRLSVATLNLPDTSRPSTSNSASHESLEHDAVDASIGGGTDSDTGASHSDHKHCLHPACSSITKFGRAFHLDVGAKIEDYAFLYIGEESMLLSNLMLTYSQCEFYTYSPSRRTARKESVNVNKKLMKRYYLVEKARDAAIVGILVGTLGVQDYLAMLTRLRTLLKAAGKRSYVFSVGKLNVPKLANFMEVDIFVLVACPENSLLDSSEFYKPVVTPYEMELACNPDRRWGEDYVLDYRELLPGGSAYKDISSVENQEERTDVSLITGRVRKLGHEQVSHDSDSGSMALAHRDDMAVSTAAEFLSSRTWHGLEPKLGQTEVKKASKGTRGIAIQYEDEPAS